MKNHPSFVSVTPIGTASLNAERRAFPLYASSVAAGFPSPADDYLEQPLDLNDFCVRNPPATIFVRVEEGGYSMRDAGILPGDILAVDRSILAQHGDIVVACLDAEFTVKEYVEKPVPALVPHNPEYAEISLAEREAEIIGVVVTVIRKIGRAKQFAMR